jgi:hypothetical protein
MLLIYNMNIGFLFNMHELLESVDQYHLESMDDNVYLLVSRLQASLMTYLIPSIEV